jgi:hypothetical protein
VKSVATIAAALCAGLLFGAGLAVSGMVSPAKILSFLDIAAIAGGRWDGTLLLVMAGALAVTFVGYRWVLKRPSPILGGAFRIPTASKVDRKLLTGAALFGLGWGLVGYCPGPAIASLAWPLLSEPALFVVAMATGFWIGGKSH